MTKFYDGDKQLDVTKAADLGSDVETFGDPDQWVLISKAWSKEKGWMKSTKAMQIDKWGCFVQVSTQQGDHVAEALTFAARVKIDTSGKHPKLVYTTI